MSHHDEDPSSLVDRLNRPNITVEDFCTIASTVTSQQAANQVINSLDLSESEYKLARCLFVWVFDLYKVFEKLGFPTILAFLQAEPVGSPFRVAAKSSLSEILCSARTILTFNEIQHVSDLELYLLDNPSEVPRLVRSPSGSAIGLEWRSMAGHLDKVLKLGRVLQKSPKSTRVNWQYFFSANTREFDPREAIRVFLSEEFERTESPLPPAVAHDDPFNESEIQTPAPVPHNQPITERSVQESLEEVMKPRPRFQPDLLEKIDLGFLCPSVVDTDGANEIWGYRLRTDQEMSIRRHFQSLIRPANVFSTMSIQQWEPETGP